jgi:hypothetical protein
VTARISPTSFSISISFSRLSSSTFCSRCSSRSPSILVVLLSSTLSASLPRTSICSFTFSSSPATRAFSSFISSSSRIKFCTELFPASTDCSAMSCAIFSSRYAMADACVLTLWRSCVAKSV